MNRPTKKRHGNEHLPSHDDSNTADTSGVQLANFDADMMQQQLALFLRNGDVDSAQILGELLVSVALVPADSIARNSKRHAAKGPDNSFLSKRSNDDLAATSHCNRTLPPAFHAKTLRLFADLLFAKREFKRAIVSCRAVDNV